MRDCRRAAQGVGDLSSAISRRELSLELVAQDTISPQADVVLLILARRGRRRHEDAAACRAQRVWRGYRTRVLLGRFRMLRYLAAFREWNPDLATFAARKVVPKIGYEDLARAADCDPDVMGLCVWSFPDTPVSDQPRAARKARAFLDAPRGESKRRF